jgi:hypothetical protein
MFARIRKQFRSWMLIYAGLVAAIILSAQPTPVGTDTLAEGTDLPAIVSAPLLRRDI